MYRKKIVLVISLLGVFIGSYFVFNFYQIFFWSNTRFNNEASYVFIDNDDTIDYVAVQLEPILKSVDWFRIAAQKKGYSDRVKPGKFKLTPGLGNNEIINILRSQRLTVKVVFNNQERLEDLAERIATQIEPSKEELLDSFYDEAFLKENGFKFVIIKLF